ncbi:AAA family ATPase [bacterium]|nr:AAA family ATPase [bacterium]
MANNNTMAEKKTKLFSENEYDDFMKTYSLERLEKMKLEEYVSFYTTITYTSKDRPFFGNIKGFDPIGFGIYKANEQPKNEQIKYLKYNNNDSYAWKINKDTPEDAYEEVRNTIVNIAKTATKIKEDENNNIEKTLKDIEEIPGVAQSFKWKIAFLYSGKKLINWYSKYWLSTFIEKLEPDNTFNSDSTADMQLKLMKIRKEKFNGDEDFDKKLYSIFINSDLTELLESTHNIILHGAPGTGKTYLAREIAEVMNAEVGFVQFHPSYDYTDFVEGLRPVNKNNNRIGFERKDGVFKKFCEKALEVALNFNIDLNTAYSNFLKKIRTQPLILETNTQEKEFTISVNHNSDDLFITPGGSESGTTIHEKDFKQYCNDHKLDKNDFYNSYLPVIEKFFRNKYLSPKKYVFIIDEINRGEMSKIFGELFYSIDPGYRVDVSKIKEKKPITIRTQYANMQDSPNEFDEALGIEKKDENKDNYGHFFVPDNVYIIGTMNDIDRSVESMDFAMRRRFTFKEIKAEDNTEMLNQLGDKAEKARTRMQNLNNAIKDIPGLSSAYHIGAAYFLKLKDLNNNFKLLWEYHLEPLLKEYLRGQDIDGKRLKDLKDIFFQKSKKNSKNQPDIPEDDDEDNYGAEEQ